MIIMGIMMTIHVYFHAHPNLKIHYLKLVFLFVHLAYLQLKPQMFVLQCAHILFILTIKNVFLLVLPLFLQTI